MRKFMFAFAFLCAPVTAHAECCLSTTGSVYYSSSSGCVGTPCYYVGPSNPEPSTSKTPRENIEILLKRAKDDYKEEDEKWFVSNKKRDTLKQKVDTYSKLLKELPE